MKKFTLPILALGALASSAHGVVLYSQNFDSLADGNIVGQDGWVAQAAGSTFNVGAGGKSGKGLIFDTDPAGSSWAWKDLAFTPTTGQTKLVVSVDISGGLFAAGAGGAVTSRFGIDIYNGAGDRIVGGAIRFAGGTTTQAQFTTYAASQVNTNTTLVAGTWHNFVIAVDTLTNKADYILDGTLMSTVSYTTDDSSIGDADIFSSVIGFDIGKYDNYKVQAVPEPGTMAALGLGLLAVARRRKNRK